MVPYRYVKRQQRLSSRTDRIKFGWASSKYLAGLLVVLGILFFINASYPIISYQLLVSPRFSQTFVSPSSEAAIAQSFGVTWDQSPSASSRQRGRQASANDKVEVLGTEIDLVDYTKASNWFPDQKAVFVQSESSAYLLSIPKLGIKEAKVVVGMEDLKKSLIQYPGTAMPGRFGNTVIFGHSVLPQFFNPKNYISIFSTLPTLRIGDEIVMEYEQISYKYLVEQMIEVVPDDISILAQRFDDSYVTLITCVPPGTFLRRLIVRARLSKI